MQLGPRVVEVGRDASSTLGMVHRCLDPQVIQEGRPKTRQQAAADPVGGGTVRFTIELDEPLLEEHRAGLQTVAEQVSGRGDRAEQGRGLIDRADREVSLASLGVRVGGGHIVIARRGLRTDGRQDVGVLEGRQICRKVAQARRYSSKASRCDEIATATSAPRSDDLKASSRRPASS